MNLSLLIPAYNEIENIQRLPALLFPVLQLLAQANTIELVLVDDGSQDGTRVAMQALIEAARPLGVNIVICGHERNRGLGAALRTGFSAATGEVIVTTDCDGTYPFSEIPALLGRLEPGVDIVTASPYHPQGDVAGVPAYRLILSKGASLIYRLLLDRRIYTYTAMFRAYRRSALASLPLASDDYLAITELLVLALLNGSRIVEHPAVLHRRQYGVSKTRLLRILGDHLRFQARIMLHHMGLKTLPWLAEVH